MVIFQQAAPALCRPQVSPCFLLGGWLAGLMTPQEQIPRTRPRQCLEALSAEWVEPSVMPSPLTGARRLPALPVRAQAWPPGVLGPQTRAHSQQESQQEWQQVSQLGAQRRSAAQAEDHWPAWL